MKNRAKGLLALCLAMCMVLAMTTVAFGANYTFGEFLGDEWKQLNANDTVEAKSSGCGIPFYVVDENGKYLTAAHTSGANGQAYSSMSETSSNRSYFTYKYVDNILVCDTFALPAVKDLFGESYAAGYHYEAKAITSITENSDAAATATTTIDKLYGKVGTNEYFLLTNALMLKAVENSNYTVKYDLDGGSFTTTPPNKTGNVKWTDKVLDGVANPKKDGFTFDGWWYKEFPNVQINAATAYSDLAGSDAVMSIELKALWKDSSAVSPNPTPNPSTPDETPNAPSGGDTIHRQNVTADAKADTTKTDTIASPKTFDAGVAVYAGLSLLSAAGTAIVIGRKKEF